MHAVDVTEFQFFPNVHNVTKFSFRFDDVPVARALLAVVVAAALLAGLYGRFKGIGVWPLGVDEFYLSRSVDNILRSGLPAFSCGGYYTRGLLYQYLVTGARLLGASPEFAGRVVAAASSLATLPAAYLLGKRVQGPLVGWLAVIILCVSTWEIEMARFARMYAPFQAVFTWYLVYFLRYTVDRDTVLKWLVALSVLGASIWEGGVLLGFANIFAVLLVHDRGRLKGMDVLRLAALCVLVVVLFYGSRDMRGFAPMPPGTAPVQASGALPIVAAWFAPLRSHWSWNWSWSLILPLAFVCASARWIAAQRRQWLTALGLCAVVIAAMGHWFVLSASLLVLLLLAGLIDWRELAAPGARSFWLALGSLLLFWLAFDLRFGAALADTAARTDAGAVLPPRAQFLFGFPDIYDEILRPWGRTLRMLAAAIGFAFAAWCLRVVRARDAAVGAVAALLSLIIVIILVVGAIPTNRIESRYTFFLYPILLVLAVAGLMSLLQRLKIAGRAPVVAAAIPLACFGATQDFQPRHIAQVDSARVNFRVGMSPVLAAHYYPRNDVRAAGDWLARHVQPGDVVVTGIPSLDAYYPRFDYFFLGQQDNRYEDYVCPNGRTERWTNHPVLYGVDALSPVGATSRVFAVLYPDAESRLLNAAQSRGWSVTRIWSAIDGQTDIVLIGVPSRR